MNKSTIWHSHDLEFVECDYCGSRSHLHIYTRPDELNVVKCIVCGLYFVNPRPNGLKINNLYNLDYYNNSNGHEAIGYKNYLDNKLCEGLLISADVRISLVSGEMNLKGKKILEIGCASGEFCYLARKWGAEVIGIDISEEAISVASERFKGITFRTGDMRCLKDEELFDAIFAFEVIEHVPSPKLFFKEIALHLMPGGFFILITPNLECGKNTGMDRWLGFNSSFEHLYFFSPDILISFGKGVGLIGYRWYTGGGSGRLYTEGGENKGYRSIIRLLLKNIGLLNATRKIRRILRTRRIFRRIATPDMYGYAQTEDFHNILMCYRNAN